MFANRLEIRTRRILIRDFFQYRIGAIALFNQGVRHLSLHGMRSLLTSASLLLFIFFRAGKRPQLVNFIFKGHRRVSPIDIIVNFLPISFCGQPNVIIDVRDDGLTHYNERLILELLKDRQFQGFLGR